MEKIIVRYIIFLKQAVRAKITWLELLLMICLTVLFAAVTVPDADNTKVALYGESAEAGEVIEELINSSSAFSFEKVNSRSELEDKVRSGAAECGFIFRDGFEDYFSSDEDEGIIFASSPFTVKGMAAKETVFAVLLRRYSGLLLERETGNIFADPDEGASLTAEQYERIINSDEVFSVKYETVKGEYPSGKKKSKADLTENFPVHGIIALMILVFSLFSESENRFGKYRSFGRAFTAGERMVIFAEKRLASLTIPALAGVIAVRIMEAGTSFFMDLLLMLAFILYTTFWCTLFSSFFKREEAYICWSLLIFALSFLVTPVLWNIGEYLPLAAKLSCLLPNGAYMYLLELWS